MQGDEFLSRMRANKKDPILWAAIDKLTNKVMKQQAWKLKLSTEEAEDIAQITHQKIFRSWNTYKDKGSLEAWVRQIYLNTFKDNFRRADNRNNRELLRLDAPLNHPSDAEEDTSTMFNTTASELSYPLDDYLDKQYAYFKMQQKIEEDNDKQLENAAEIVCWVVENDKPSEKELAAHLGIKQSTAAERKSVAFMLIKDWFEQFCNCDLSKLSQRKK